MSKVMDITEQTVHDILTNLQWLKDNPEAVKQIKEADEYTGTYIEWLLSSYKLYRLGDLNED